MIVHFIYATLYTIGAIIEFCSILVAGYFMNYLCNWCYCKSSMNHGNT